MITVKIKARSRAQSGSSDAAFAPANTVTEVQEVLVHCQ
jgi:hypothetical protein